MIRIINGNKTYTINKNGIYLCYTRLNLNDSNPRVYVGLIGDGKVTDFIKLTGYSSKVSMPSFKSFAINFSKIRAVQLASSTAR